MKIKKTYTDNDNEISAMIIKNELNDQTFLIFVDKDSEITIETNFKTAENIVKSLKEDIEFYK